ncbi:MAG: hypothetical protein N2560_04940 [Ignavibacteria bacterium]|nr:hypothetical protein [Ignavibacteria bacterium]
MSLCLPPLLQLQGCFWYVPSHASSLPFIIKDLLTTLEKTKKVTVYRLD